MPSNCGAGEDSWKSLGQQWVNLKGAQPWIFTRRTDAEAKAPVFWSSDGNRQLIGKVPDAGKDWGQKEKMVSEDEMAGQHHRCNEHELGQTLGDGEGQGGLVRCSPWGGRVGHDRATEQHLNPSSLSFPCSVHKSVLYVCISIPALQIDFFFKERIKEPYIIVCQNRRLKTIFF